MSEADGSDAFAGVRRFARSIGALTRLTTQIARSPKRFIADVDNYMRRRGITNTSMFADDTSIANLPSIVPLNIRIDDSLPARLNVILPGLSMKSMSGGPNTAINLTYRLAKAGVPLRYISCDSGMDDNMDPVWEHFSAVSGVDERLANVELVSGHDRCEPVTIGANDGFWGTAWWTVQIIRRILPRVHKKKFFYIVQEFEPGLYPYSTEYASALQTYQMNSHSIVCSQLLADYLIDTKTGNFGLPEFTDDCLIFEPAIDRSRFYIETSTSAKKRLLFYGRPQAPRNMWPLGLAVLRQAVDQGLFKGDWEFISMGEPVDEQPLGNDAVLKPHPWLDFDGYASLLRSADVGLSLMLSPHTSYPPLEMAACGVPVVTNTFGPKNQQRLADLSANIIAGPPDVDSLVTALQTAIQRSDEQCREGSKVSVPANWNETFDPLIPELLTRWENLA